MGAPDLKSVMIRRGAARLRRVKVVMKGVDFPHKVGGTHKHLSARKWGGKTRYFYVKNVNLIITRATTLFCQKDRTSRVCTGSEEWRVQGYSAEILPPQLQAPRKFLPLLALHRNVASQKIKIKMKIKVKIIIKNK